MAAQLTRLISTSAIRRMSWCRLHW